MYFNRESSPVNLAFKNSNTDNFSIASILPPYPDSNPRQHMNNNNFENLKEFRSRILEMDDEINQFKKTERKKQLLHHKNENHPHDYQCKNNFTFKDESSSNTERLIEEQKKRITELERQFEQLKMNNSHLRHGPTELEENRHGETHDMDHQRIEYEKELDEKIYKRIGDWTPKDPYQGPMQNLYFPFGSSGGGAPRRDENGNIHATMVGNKNFNSSFEERQQKFLASQSLQESYQRDMLQEKLRRLQDKQQIREPNGDFSDLISSFKVGKPKRDPLTGMLVNNHLGSSDVTNIKLDSSRIPTPKVWNDNNKTIDSETQTYGMELLRAAKEREVMKYLDKLREHQENRQHMRSWNNIWGPTDHRNHYSNKTNSRLSSNHRNFYELTNRNI